MDNMDKNDSQLIKIYLEGDELAFEQLLEKYLKPVFNLLYHLTGDPKAAEDLMQITFIKV